MRTPTPSLNFEKRKGKGLLIEEEESHEKLNEEELETEELLRAMKMPN